MRDRVVVCNSGISSDTVRPDDPRVVLRLGILCLGVFSERSPCGVRVGTFLLSLLRINADYADAAFGCATRRCRSQARDLLSQPLWRCQTKFLIYLYRVFSLAAPKRLRQQVSPKAKQRRAARASARISVISVFSHLPTANRRNPHNKFEPVPSLFIPPHIQYYNQRRESR